MLNFAIILFIVAFGLHVFYDNMPYDLFDKFGNIVKKSTMVLPAVAVCIVIASSISSTYLHEAKAKEESLDYAAVEKQLADLRKEVAGVKSDIALSNDSAETAFSVKAEEQYTALEAALEKAMKSTSNDIKAVTKDQKILRSDVDELIAKVKEMDTKSSTSTKSLQKTTTVKSNSSSGSGSTVYIPTGIYLRKAADGDSSILLTIPAGSSCTYLGEETGWYHVSYNGTKGYVSRRLTERR